MSNLTSALDALRAELKEVETQLAQYEDLRKRRERLLRAIEATEEVEAMARPTATPQEEFGVTVRRLLAQQLPSAEPETPSEAAILILKELGRPTHIRELVALIQGKGWWSNRPYESLRATIAGTLDARATKKDSGVMKPEPATYFWDASLGRPALAGESHEDTTLELYGNWRKALGQHGQQGGQ